ncbi:hypothetical protein GCM10027341_52100 [Spirosoma knui]
MVNGSHLLAYAMPIDRLLPDNVADVSDESGKNDDFTPKRDFFSLFTRQNV